MKTEYPQYVVRKSLWSLFTLPIVLTVVVSLVLAILLSVKISAWFILILLVPIVLLTVEIKNTLNDRIEFYEQKVAVKSGWISRKEQQFVLVAVQSVNVKQSVIGRIFNFGDVQIDVTGKWDVDTSKIKNPFGLKNYLQSKVSGSASGVVRMMRD